MSKQRNISKEFLEGIGAFEQHKAGKITLRTHFVEPKPIPGVNPHYIRATRKKFDMSRAVFARLLNISIRTLERWEQGISKPNHQASILIRMSNQYPDTFKRINTIATHTESEEGKKSA